MELCRLFKYTHLDVYKRQPQDIQFTKRMEECGEMMGIQLLDHIIVGDSGYISLREENFFASE
ncbi:DNA repair protein RadC [Enterococcus faecalis]|nr:DNA repair protein RadC [Enterococcus faecalis]